jgi:hypothetical protein
MYRLLEGHTSRVSLPADECVFVAREAFAGSGHDKSRPYCRERFVEKWRWRVAKAWAFEQNYSARVGTLKLAEDGKGRAPNGADKYKTKARPTFCVVGRALIIMSMIA